MVEMGATGTTLALNNVCDSAGKRVSESLNSFRMGQEPGVHNECVDLTTLRRTVPDMAAPSFICANDYQGFTERLPHTVPAPQRSTSMSRAV